MSDRTTGSGDRPPLDIRSATVDDAADCARIYAHYVEQTSATFEIVAPTPEEMAARIDRAQRRHAWLVALAPSGTRGDDPAHAGRADRPVGFAYAGPYRDRAAYDWTCETSVYLDPQATARGVGTALYTRLIAELRALGRLRAIATIALPNPGSVALHHRFGFREGPVLERVGYKFGRWHDVTLMQADLTADPLEPPVQA